MHYAVIAAIFVLSVYQTIRRGPGGAFAYVFLPVLLCLSVVRPISVTGLPDIFSPMAVSYGVLVGMLLAGRTPAFRPHLVDWVILLCSVTVVMTGYKNGNFWTLVSATGAETLRWIVPYYMARLAFREPALRRRMALTLCYIAMALGAMGAIEFRLWPLFFSRLIERMGMSAALNDVVQGRWKFFRAMVTCEHPIDFGTVGVLLCGLVPALAVAGGLRLRDWRVRGALVAAVAIVVESISFSSFMGLAAGVAIFVVLYYLRSAELLLVPGVVAAIAGGFIFTQHLLSIDLESIKPANVEEALDGSFYVRTLIVQRSWENFAHDAGLLGFGDNNITREALGLESVDNSYMLFLMRRGWSHLCLRLSLAVMIAYLGMKMLQRSRSPQARLPVAAMLGALLGTMVSMYTVWFGFVYAVLWTVALGMFVTMRQMIAERALAEARGFAVQVPPLRPRRPDFEGGRTPQPLGTPLIASGPSAR